MSELLLPESVESRWLELIAETEPKHKLMLPESALRLYYGRSKRGLPQFFIRSKVRPPVPGVSSSIDASVARRQDNEWALRFELVDAKFTHTFMSLAWNLAQSSSSAATEEEGLGLFMAELAAWKRLLAFHASDRLSLGEIRGVYAELWFALEVLAKSQHLSVVLDSWGGPAGAPQDYASPLPVSYEVKSVYPEAKSVRISSAEQLDCEGPLELVVVRLVDMPTELLEGESLPQIIERYFKALGMDNQRKERLAELLERSLRVDIDDEYYQQFHFSVQGLKAFEVGENFPSIKRSALTPSISKVDYSLSLAGLAAFEVGKSEATLNVEMDAKS